MNIGKKGPVYKNHNGKISQAMVTPLKFHADCIFKSICPKPMGFYAVMISEFHSVDWTKFGRLTQENILINGNPSNLGISACQRMHALLQDRTFAMSHCTWHTFKFKVVPLTNNVHMGDLPAVTGSCFDYIIFASSTNNYCLC